MSESETSEIIEEKEQESEILTTLPESKTQKIIEEESERKENVIKYQYLEDEEIIKQTIDQLSNNSILWLDTETADWDKPKKKTISITNNR